VPLPFTTDQFFAVFEAYNRAIWPAQVTAYVLGVLAVALAARGGARNGRRVAGVLALFWLWTGVAYHWAHFSQINRTAYLFGAVFVLQGVLLAAAAVRGTLAFRFRPDARGWMGAALMAYALAVYPLIGHLLSHGWPRSPVFGVAPCPTTIFTVGLLLWTGRAPRNLVIVPVLWSLVGASAAVLLAVREDLGLLAAAAAGVWMLWRPGGTAPA
jgi:hypothetical protein